MMSPVIAHGSSKPAHLLKPDLSNFPDVPRASPPYDERAQLMLERNPRSRHLAMSKTEQTP